MGDCFPLSRSTSPESPSPRPTRSRQLYTYSLLILTSSLASDQLSRLSQQSRITVLSFPFSSSITFVCILHCIKRRKRIATSYSDGLGETVKGLLSGRDEKKLGWATAGTLIGSLALRVWSLRWTDQGECFAIDVCLSLALPKSGFI